jgi:excisionase family DNA binding protein
VNEEEGREASGEKTFAVGSSGQGPKFENRLADVDTFFENQIKREWLSTKEAAHFLSVSENALRIMVHRDQIPRFKLGRRLRFRLSDCRALFERKGA